MKEKGGREGLGNDVKKRNPRKRPYHWVSDPCMCLFRGILALIFEVCDLLLST